MKPMVSALSAALALSLGMGVSASATAGKPSPADNTSSDKVIKIIHMGDVHGHTLPRANARSDGDGRMEGGLARMYSKIKSIRGSTPANTLLINTGDTIQGSGEALYSGGQALVDVLDMFSINAYAPGNWDFVYGVERFDELFGTGRWGGLSANAYRQTITKTLDPVTGVETSAVSKSTTRVLPATAIKVVNGVTIGIIGCTTNRGPQVVGNWVTDGIFKDLNGDGYAETANGFWFSDCTTEVQQFVTQLRDPARVSSGTGDPGGAVDQVFLISEIEIGRNIQLAKLAPGIDFIFNADMHEETTEPVSVTYTRADGSTGTTRIVEEGQDGTTLGELELEFSKDAATGKYMMKDWDWTAHRIHDGIKPDSKVAAKVAAVRAPYTVNFTPNTHKNPFNGTYLKGSLDTIVGQADVALHRSNFSDEHMPAAIEGSSHNWVTDAIRWWAKSDLSTLRGFRYGTHIAAGGAISRNDLFHYVPIGPRVGKVSRINLTQLRNQVDNSSAQVFGSNPGADWRGGWLFAYSADDFSMGFDPYYVQQGVVSPATADSLATQTSRSRLMTMQMDCDRLPPSDTAKVNCVGRAASTANNAVDGVWTDSWKQAYTDATGALVSRSTVSLTSNGWTYANTKAKYPFQYPAVSVAGYFYAQNPDTINNCDNCTAIGTSSDVESSEAPYVMPVNVNPATGEAMLDSNGNPVYLRDAAGAIVRDAKNRPQAAGDAIDLTEVMEKYLAANAGHANPELNRIKLVNPLPGRASNNGTPFMQPLCGTIGKDPLAPYVCP